jgi:hypothetical protein
VVPVPVCPQGVVATSGDGFEEPPQPGGSSLDAGLGALREAGLVSDEGGVSDASPEGGGS